MTSLNLVFKIVIVSAIFFLFYLNHEYLQGGLYEVMQTGI